MGHNLDLSSFPQPDPPKFKSLSELIPIPTHDTQTPSPASSSQTTSSLDKPWEPSGANSEYDSESMSSQSPQHHVSPPPNLPGSSQGLVPPDQLSTGESRPPTIGPTNNRPPLASSSNTGPSAELNPPPGAKRPRPEEHESGDLGSLSKIFKGKLKRRLSGSGVLNASQRDSQGKFNSRVYVTATSLPLLSTNDCSHEHSDILINHQVNSPATSAICGIIDRGLGLPGLPGPPPERKEIGIA
jgi:hypothetical protein